MTAGTLRELWQERGRLGPAFATAIGVGYLPLLVLPWTYGALVTRAGYSASQAGWIATLEVGALATTALLAAGRATRPGRRSLAAAGTLLTIVANAIAIVVAPGSALFLMARVCSGTGLGVAVAVGNAAAAGSSNPTRAFAVLWFLMALWQLIIFNLTPLVIAHLGLPGAYGLIAGVCLAFLPLILRTPDPGAVGPDVESSAKKGAVRGVLAVATLAAFLAFWLRDALVFSMSERLAADLGIDGQRLGVILGVASVLGLLGPALAARLGAGEPPRGLLVASLLLALGASAVMALGMSPLAFGGATLLLPATGLFAASLLSGFAADIDKTGRLVAIGAGIGFVSEAIGPAIGGTLMEAGGRGMLFVAVIVIGAISIAAVAAAARLERASRGHADPTTVAPGVGQTQ